MTFDDRVRPHKIARYTPDLLPDDIYVASEKSVSNFTTPYDSPRLFLLTSDDPNHPHIMNKYEPYRGRLRREYCSRKHDKKILQKYEVLLLHML